MRTRITYYHRYDVRIQTTHGGLETTFVAVSQDALADRIAECYADTLLTWGLLRIIPNVVSIEETLCPCGKVCHAR